MRKVTLLFVLPALAPILLAQNSSPHPSGPPPATALSVPVLHPLIAQGLAAEKGDGRSPKYEDARRLYEQAAQLGVPEGSFYLGRLYLEGWGVPRDPARAASLIETAANAGLRSAQLMLCDMYLTGIGVAHDPTAARHWAEKAAAQDDPAAEVRFGKLIESGRLGIRPDIRLAREWYQLSAEQDYTKALTAMAQSFLKPGATDLDREFAARWLELAVENGNAAAAYVLAVLCVARAPDDPAALQRAEQLLKQSAAAHHGLLSYDASTVLKKHADGSSLLDAFRYVLGSTRQTRETDARQNRLASWEKADRVPPRIIDRPRLVIPDSVKLKQLKGNVTLQFMVTKAGFVENIEVLSSDHPALTEIAVNGVQKARYLPALKNGARIAMKVRQSFKIAFDDPEFDLTSLPAALPEEMTTRPPAKITTP